VRRRRVRLHLAGFGLRRAGGGGYVFARRDVGPHGFELVDALHLGDGRAEEEIPHAAGEGREDRDVWIDGTGRGLGRRWRSFDGASRGQRVGIEWREDVDQFGGRCRQLSLLLLDG